MNSLLFYNILQKTDYEDCIKYKLISKDILNLVDNKNNFDLYKKIRKSTNKLIQTINNYQCENIALSFGYNIEVPKINLLKSYKIKEIEIIEKNNNVVFPLELKFLYQIIGGQDINDNLCFFTYKNNKAYIINLLFIENEIKSWKTDNEKRILHLFNNQNEDKLIPFAVSQNLFDLFLMNSKNGYIYKTNLRQGFLNRIELLIPKKKNKQNINYKKPLEKLLHFSCYFH